MANIKSAKKRAKQNIVRKNINLSRRTAIKTVVKKMITALEGGQLDDAQKFLKEAEAKMARAASKRVMHKKTAMRKTGRLAKRLSAAQKATAEAAKAAEATK